MTEVFTNFINSIPPHFFTQTLSLLVFIITGILILRILIALTQKILLKKATDQIKMLVTKTINYTGLTIIVFFVLSELGVQAATLFGAAGVVGIAVGIASQTSLSHIISGMFLISEKPFEIGDVVSVENITGIIHSIDLLSIKIRKFDNQFVRIPNERILNTNVVNITKFPIRRLDFSLRVDLQTDLPKLQKVLKKIAYENTHCLEEPEPIILFKEFEEWSISVLLGVWFEKSNYVTVKNTIFQSIQEDFKKEGIIIPKPYRIIINENQSKETEEEET
ncbi:MAG: mechanosensitive ion channel family protein [Spirochaetia bacterium]